VVLLEPLAGQDLPAFLELRVDELHSAPLLSTERDGPADAGGHRVGG
jgi:hypothetical protein